MRKSRVLATCAIVASIPFGLATGYLWASLPRMDGDVTVPQLESPLTIERDGSGVPTIRAGSRADAAFATGFLHGQDRFFQMDISRRLAAGELSELAGDAAVNRDKKARVFRFRHLAQQVVEASNPEQQKILAAYAAGVNAGLGSLSARPWEYWLLRTAPRAWRIEDSVLVIYAMWWDLQYNGFKRDMLRVEMNERLQGKVCAYGWKCALTFFYPARTRWDAPDKNSGPENSGPENSGPYNDEESPLGDLPASNIIDVRDLASKHRIATQPMRTPAIGSNGWAVAGRFTATGSALVANDMHLGLRVPTAWYRARLLVTAVRGAAPVDVTGVTLPGTPLVVAGSNGHIAWGFTNSFGKWLNSTLVNCSAVYDDGLSTAAGSEPLRTEWEDIHVRGGADVRLAVRTGGQGTLIESDPEHGQCWFGSWLAQNPGATNLNLMMMEGVSSVAEAIALAPTVGIPHQNVVIGDREGHVGWTVFGRILTDTDGVTGSWTSVKNHPRLLDPPIGRIWTANARVTDNPSDEAILGGRESTLGADYNLGARARQIRDDLLALNGPATPLDMLRVQLDDRAVFLARWRDLLLQVLDDEALANQPARTEFRRLVENWSGRANVDAVGYRLVRAYHDQMASATWSGIMEGLDVSPPVDAELPAQFDEPLWRLVTLQPMNLLPPRYSSWKHFLRTELDVTIAELAKECVALSRCTWGMHNEVHVSHPLSKALPFLSWLLDMPRVNLPGDDDMPRVQQDGVGASERFAVSPGHEDQGYFHMPGGQSGNPLSPYYKAGFDAWARGQALPFLPGHTKHTLRLVPL